MELKTNRTVYTDRIVNVIWQNYTIKMDFQVDKKRFGERMLRYARNVNTL